MFVETINRSFTVIRMLSSTNCCEISVCKDLTEEKNKTYLLVCLKDMDIIYKTITFFTSLKENTSFEDFVDCFSQNGYFYIVFDYKEKDLLYDKIKEKGFHLKERLEIAKNLLTEITLQNMPKYLQYEALSQNNLLLDDTLTVKFNYSLNEIDKFGILTTNKFEIRLVEVFELIFQNELEAKISVELENFITDLAERKYKSYIEIYKAFNEVYSLLINKMAEGSVEPQSFWFKLWNFIKGLAKYIKPVIGAILVLVLIGYLIYSIKNPEAVTANANGVKFQSIGTVDLV